MHIQGKGWSAWTEEIEASKQWGDFRLHNTHPNKQNMWCVSEKIKNKYRDAFKYGTGAENNWGILQNREDAICKKGDVEWVAVIWQTLWKKKWLNHFLCIFIWFLFKCGRMKEGEF